MFVEINEKRIQELAGGYDNTNEINSKTLKNLKNVNFSKNIDDLKKCNIYIVTVPTPVDIKNKPNLKSLLNSFIITSFK